MGPSASSALAGVTETSSVSRMIDRMVIVMIMTTKAMKIRALHLAWAQSISCKKKDEKREERGALALEVDGEDYHFSFGWGVGLGKKHLEITLYFKQNL